MTGLPNDPIDSIPATASPNLDLPATDFPSLDRINVTNKVGPQHANKQHKSLEKRTETLRTTVNDLVDDMNEVDNNFLRRDGSTQKDSTAGMTDDLPMGDNKIVDLAAGTIGSGSKEAINGDQLNTEQAARIASDALKANLAGPTFTGDPKAPTPTVGDNDTSIATTAFVQAAVPTAVEVTSGSHTFTATRNCLATIYATGGGGAGNSDNTGSGAAGAGLNGLSVPLSSGDSIVVTVGAAGSANGGAGGDTTIDVIVAATYVHRIRLGGGGGGTNDGGSTIVANTALGGTCYVLNDLRSGSADQWVAAASPTASSPGQTSAVGGPQGGGPYVAGGNGTPNANNSGNASHSGGTSIFAFSKKSENARRGAGGAAGANTPGNGYNGGPGYAVIIVVNR